MRMMSYFNTTTSINIITDATFSRVLEIIIISFSHHKFFVKMFLITSLQCLISSIILSIKSETAFTAPKTISSFSKYSEKMVFPKHWSMIFLALSGKMVFLLFFGKKGKYYIFCIFLYIWYFSPTNMILPFCQKIKDDLFLKNTLKDAISNIFEIWYFF